ncbi:MAG: hypothetical protein IKP88_12190 [Lachnospiraceae bacterium]|nr:hypothetical protein [Lachnospiraceae bacterium]
MNEIEHTEIIETTETLKASKEMDVVVTLNSTSEFAEFLKENDGKIVSVRIEFAGGTDGR